MTFKDLILSIEITPEKRNYLVTICSDWGRYCDAITRMDRMEVMQLLKYLTSERPYSKRLLQRAISRFNRLNALRKEALK